MRKDSIELKVAKQKTMRIEAYLTSEPEGLAIHRAVVWVPAKNEHKFISKWTVTHVASGLSILRPSDYLTTMAACIDLTKNLTSVDWTEPDLDALYKSKSEVMKVLSVVKDTDYDEEEQEAPRYTIRRARGVGYEVIDLATDTVIESFAHRGIASSFAREKNAKESV